MKLKFNKNGETHTVNLVEDPPSMHRIAINKGGKTYYAKRGETNHPEASPLDIYKGGKSLAVIKNYDPATFDECGNTWAYAPSVTQGFVSSEGAVFGTALHIKKSPIWQQSPVEIGGEDFTVDFFFSLIEGNDTTTQTRVLECSTQKNTTTSGVLFNITVRGGTNVMSVWGSRFNFSSELNLFSQNSLTIGIPRHYELVYCHNDNRALFFDNGELSSSVENVSLPKQSVYFMLSRSSIDYSSMDEFRFSSGIARHTSNFSPPISQHEVDQYTKILLHF